MSPNNPLNENATSDPIRRPRRKLPALVDVALPACAVGSGAMLLFAVPNIIGGDDFLSYAKAFTLAATATAVSYGVNKLAIERGAPLATTGYLGAGLVSVASVMFVGAGLAAATYSGLTFKNVAELQLQEHGAALVEHVGKRENSASKAGRVGPAIRSIADDLKLKRDCELAASCISGYGAGGPGPVTRTLEAAAGRAITVEQRVAEGASAREAATARLKALIADYQAVLGDEETGIWERRARLQLIDGDIRQTLGRLDEAMPLALLGAYADELKARIVIPERPAAAERVNAILAKHGESFSAVLASIDGGDTAQPVFPKRTGVSDTFDYIGHFLPVAAITAVVELVFPLVLWIYTFLALHWEIFKRQARREQMEAGAADAVSAPASVPNLPIAETSASSVKPARRSAAKRRRAKSRVQDGQGSDASAAGGNNAAPKQAATRGRPAGHAANGHAGNGRADRHSR